MTKFALQACWVVPIETPPIQDGVVTIENEQIVAVGTRAAGDATTHDLGEVVLLPGFVNAHTHLEFSQLDKPLGRSGMTLPEWIRLVITNRRQQTDAVAGLVAGISESLRAGVTTVGEIATSNLPADESRPSPEVIAFQEVIGFSAARIDSVYGELEQRLQTNSSGHPLGVSPHAPYTVHPKLLDRIVALASERRLPVAMHLAESREELQLLGENLGPFRELLEERSMWDSNVFAEGLKPMDYLQVLSHAPRSLVVHGNYLSQHEIEFVANKREQMSIVYCPRTHAYFEHQPYPLAAMLKAGVRVAIGTDSRASNPDLSLLSELRCLAQTYEDVSPEQVLTLGTLNGAEALGLAESIGSLAPGKLANLTTIALEDAMQEPLSAILFGQQTPQQTWLRGRLLVND